MNIWQDANNDASGGDNLLTGATLFAGFEGVGCGMKAAGIQHAWGIEKEDAIAAVARTNGFNVLTAEAAEILNYSIGAPMKQWRLWL